MAINVPAHDITQKREEGWIWATDKENTRRVSLVPPLPPLTPKNYLAEIEKQTGDSYYRQKIQEAANVAAQQIITDNPTDP